MSNWLRLLVKTRSTFKRHHRIVTVIGGLLVFTTFIAKDVLRENLKDAVDSIEKAELIYEMQKPSQEVLTKLEETYSLVRRVRYDMHKSNEVLTADYGMQVSESVKGLLLKQKAEVTEKLIETRHLTDRLIDKARTPLIDDPIEFIDDSKARARTLTARGRSILTRCSELCEKCKLGEDFKQQIESARGDLTANFSTWNSALDTYESGAAEIRTNVDNNGVGRPPISNQSSNDVHVPAGLENDPTVSAQQKELQLLHEELRRLEQDNRVLNRMEQQGKLTTLEFPILIASVESMNIQMRIELMESVFFTAAKKELAKSQSHFVYATWCSYVLYTIGWALGLVGAALGARHETSPRHDG